MYIVTAERDMERYNDCGAGYLFETLDTFWIIEETNACAHKEAEKAELKDPMPQEGEDDDSEKWLEYCEKDNDELLRQELSKESSIS